ncbi:hypothetical protein EDB86DRAFT_2831008 [Lactarius hatsudake]|nr:hypothetical protein EDB86DRAFT_2831008 [Lactarius hatsudake]
MTLALDGPDTSDLVMLANVQILKFPKKFPTIDTFSALPPWLPPPLACKCHQFHLIAARAAIPHRDTTTLAWRANLATTLLRRHHVIWRYGATTATHRHGATTATQRRSATTAIRCYDSDMVSRCYDSDTMSRCYDSDMVLWRYNSDTTSRRYDSDMASRHYDSDTVSQRYDSDTVSQRYDSTRRRGAMTHMALWCYDSNTLRRYNSDMASQRCDSDMASQRCDSDMASQRYDSIMASQRDEDSGTTPWSDKDSVAARGIMTVSWRCGVTKIATRRHGMAKTTTRRRSP